MVPEILCFWIIPIISISLLALNFISELSYRIQVKGKKLINFFWAIEILKMHLIRNQIFIIIELLNPEFINIFMPIKRITLIFNLFLKKTGLLLLCFILLLVHFTNGQSVERDVFASNGVTQESGQAEISWTIGEAVVNSFFLGEYSIVSGFQQPITDSLEFVIEKDDNTVSIYPNPFFNYFVISFSVPTQEDMQIKLLGSSGYLFRNINLKKGSNLVKIEVPELASDHYSLLFFVNNELISIQKVIKIK